MKKRRGEGVIEVKFWWTRRKIPSSRQAEIKFSRHGAESQGSHLTHIYMSTQSRTMERALT